MKIGILIGSLRRDSYSRKLAHAVIALAPKSLDIKIIEIGQLPFFNQDDELNPPDSWVAFRGAIKPLDGFLFITPEYNRSVPAVLKNALDIASRPYGQSLWHSKPCAVISSSVGAMGGFSANHHLRQSLTCLNTLCMQQPEAYLSFVDKSLDEKGHVNNESTLAFLNKFILAFSDWVQRHTTYDIIKETMALSS